MSAVKAGRMATAVGDNTDEREVAIVTGAGSGIGRATAERLAADGYAVAVAELDEPRGEAVAQSIRDAGRAALFVRTDVTDAGSMRDLADTTVEHLGRLDVLVNNAGGGRPGRVHELDLADWRF